MHRITRFAALLAVGLLVASCTAAERGAIGADIADGVESVTGPSSAAQLNIFASEEKAATIAENWAATFAESGNESAATAVSVEAVRVKIDKALADGRAARDAGNNVLLAQAISALKDLTPQLTALVPAAYQATPAK